VPDGGSSGWGEGGIQPKQSQSLLAVMRLLQMLLRRSTIRMAVSWPGQAIQVDQANLGKIVEIDRKPRNGPEKAAPHARSGTVIRMITGVDVSSQ